MGLEGYQGYKTYIVAVATVCYALGGLVAGFIELSVAIPLILGALGLSGLRHGLMNFIPTYVAPSPGSAPQ